MPSQRFARGLGSLLLAWGVFWTGAALKTVSAQAASPATPAEIASLVSRVRAGPSSDRRLAARELRVSAPLPRESLASVVGLLPWVESFEEELVLEALARSCPAALPFLERALETNPGTRQAVFSALCKHKVVVTPAFMEATARCLVDPTCSISAGALLERTPAGVAFLVDLLEGGSELSKDLSFRKGALLVASRSADRYSGLFLEAGEDPSPEIRAVALFGLAQLSGNGPQRGRALAICEAALSDPEPVVREGATNAIMNFAAELGEERLVAHFERMLRDPSPQVRFNAVLDCRDLGPAAAGLIPTLAECLSRPEPEIEASYSLAYPEQVAQVLAALGIVAKPALPALVASFEREERPEVAESIKTYTTRIAEELRDSGDPPLWLPFRVHWKGCLALLLLGAAWFLGMSRVRRPRAAWARFLIASLPVAGIVTLSGLALLVDDFGNRFADELTLACIPADLDEVSFLPFALSGPLTAAFPCFVFALWSTGRGSKRLREERDQEAEAAAAAEVSAASLAAREGPDSPT